jgi:molybdopterin-guanine dinucleotide biosynthesis adapter protein
MRNGLEQWQAWDGDAVPIIAIVGRTNSGKTTLIERLIPALARQGYRVATIKRHHRGDFEADHPGKDSWRHTQAGSVATALVGANQLAIFQRPEEEVPPHMIVRLFAARPDVVLAEGYKDSRLPKIEVVRNARGGEPLCRQEDQLVALVSDGEWDLGVPLFGLDEIDALSAWLIEQFLLDGSCAERGAGRVAHPFGARAEMGAR